MDSILNEELIPSLIILWLCLCCCCFYLNLKHFLYVTDPDRILASSKLLDVDKDYFPSSRDGKIDPFKEVMIVNEVLSLDEMKNFPRTSESDDEARATNDYIEAQLEKIRNMTPEEFDAAADEACIESYVADWAAREANRKSEKALQHLQAIMETPELIELKKIRVFQSLKKAIEEAIEECYAALRELHAANHKVDRSTRLIEAISKARGKRPMTDLESPGCSCSY